MRRGILDRKMEWANFRKISAEVDEIRARNAFNKSRLGLIKPWSGFLLALSTVISGFWVTYVKIDEYLDQQERQLAFNVNKVIVELSTGIGDPTAVVRANSALLLSGFEEHAVPILVSSLSRVEFPDLPAYIEQALTLILEKERIKKEPSKVFRPLAQQMKLVFEEQNGADEPKIDALFNYLRATDQLGAGTRDSDILKSLEECDKILRSENTRISEVEVNALIEKIREVTTKVKTEKG